MLRALDAGLAAGNHSFCEMRSPSLCAQRPEWCTMAGMQQLRQSSVKPRIKPWMDEFVSHDIDDDRFADYEANDPFIQKLIRNLDGLLVGFKNSLTTNNYDGLVSILTNEVTSQLEKVVLKSR